MVARDLFNQFGWHAINRFMVLELHRLMQKPRDLSPFQKEIACGKGRVVERERKTEGVWFYIAYGRFLVLYLKSRGTVSGGGREGKGTAEARYLLLIGK